MTEAKTVNVAAAIFYKDNKILAACRADADNADFWEFPGGKENNSRAYLGFFFQSLQD